MQHCRFWYVFLRSMLSNGIAADLWASHARAVVWFWVLGDRGERIWWWTFDDRRLGWDHFSKTLVAFGMGSLNTEVLIADILIYVLERLWGGGLWGIRSFEGAQQELVHEDYCCQVGNLVMGARVSKISESLIGGSGWWRDKTLTESEQAQGGEYAL